VEEAAGFTKAYKSRGKERGAARSQTMAREAIFNELRLQTSYFRLLGREALRNSAARADLRSREAAGRKTRHRTAFCQR
jgi:hypothetical protein